jgi:hypothetical protein
VDITGTNGEENKRQEILDNKFNIERKKTTIQEKILPKKE